MNKPAKYLKVLYGLLFTLLCIFAGLMLLTKISILPQYSFYVVMSGSMYPEIPAGSLIGTHQEEMYKVGDIITVKPASDVPDTYTHRIVEQYIEPTGTSYTTKGDANDAPDADRVTEDMIVGKTFLNIPWVGHIANFANTSTGFAIMIIIPSILIISSELNVLRDELKKFIEKSRRDNKTEDSTEESIIKGSKKGRNSKKNSKKSTVKKKMPIKRKKLTREENMAKPKTENTNNRIKSKKDGSPKDKYPSKTGYVVAKKTKVRKKTPILNQKKRPTKKTKHSSKIRSKKKKI